MIIIFIFIFMLIVFTLLIFRNTTNNIDTNTFTCGVSHNAEERAIGLQKPIFKSGETVYINFIDKKDEKSIYPILQKYAFPFINLNFKIGKQQPSITIDTSSVKPSIDIDGNTIGIGTRSPTIKLWSTNQGTVLHEFGHALGLKHEQTNPSPDNKIHWNVDEVMKKYKAKKWDVKEIDRQIIQRDTSKNMLYTKFDPKSIMNYSITDPKLTTNHLILYRGKILSDGDKLWLKIKYGKKK